ncbi:class I SAM-dependent methyltransferase [Haloarcula litorea]|uniref:class I SAM-dependent methyltransferase n=1 Tax=Haloarcula litorea TaxID=3032579 RepID=UPI0023E81F91|nr:class I SAM-dependent methyltransferase [Halomicroarcula sp. GDY20]
MDLPETDAFGAMCRDYHERGDAFEVIERDDGFVDSPAGPEVYFSTPDEWSDREHAALEWAEGHVLDVGCGPGRHALELQDRGHDVTGIDRSPGAMAVARDRGVADVRECDVAAVDGLEETFDSAIMLGNNFGLVGSAERAPEVLGALADATTDDATLVASSLDPLDTDDPAHLDYHERNRERGWLPGRLRIRTRYRRYTGEWHDYLHVAPDTMGELVADTPWSVAEVERDGPLYAARLAKTA